MALWILRAIFLVSAAGVSVSIVESSEKTGITYPWLVFLLLMAGAVGLVGIDILVRKKRIETISCVYFGIVIGLFLTYLVGFAMEPLFIDKENMQVKNQKFVVQLATGVALSYICISFLLQTRDDFRFIIPFVEFAKEVKGVKPYLLDTSVVIDGRIADLVETNIFDNQLVMP